MAIQRSQRRLSQISTMWTVLAQAHGGGADAATAARQLLTERYGGAVRRYLLGALRDEDLADELTQEFALGVVRGEFRRADPQRGRFRDYVKAALFHLVSKYRGKQKRQHRSLSGDDARLAALPAPPEDAGRHFDQSWREELLARAWRALKEVQPVWHAVLHYRAAHPEASSAAMASELTLRLGKPLTADGVRQLLHRARDRFADLLLDAVAHSLEPGTADQVEDELRELNLLACCKTALERHRRG